jgi:hypothetical protein
MKRAPENSQTAARGIACFILRAPDPTDVAKALATSFAPIPYAAQKAKIPPRATIHSNCCRAFYLILLKL